jgi:hypothetical protein
LVDVNTGDVADRDSTEVRWQKGLTCTGRDCSEYQMKNCKEQMNLLFIMPDLPGAGIYQIDTSSVYSIINVNSQLAPGDPNRGVAEGFIRAIFHRISFIPLTLKLAEKEVTPKDDPKHRKKIVRVLSLDTRYSLYQLKEAATKVSGLLSVGIPKPVVDEAPDDLDDEGTFAPEDTGPHTTAEATPEQIKQMSDDLKKNAREKKKTAKQVTEVYQATSAETAKMQRAVDAGTIEQQDEQEIVFPEPQHAASENPAYQKATGQTGTERVQEVIAKADAVLEGPRAITGEQLKRIKYLKDNYTVALAPYVRKQGKDITAIDQLTQLQAQIVIDEIEKYLRGKGVL